MSEVPIDPIVIGPGQPVDWNFIERYAAHATDHMMKSVGVPAEYYTYPHSEHPMTTPPPCFGDHALWAFHAPNRAEPLIYHHKVPQIYPPDTEIAPLLVELAAIDLPRTWADLHSHARIRDRATSTGNTYADPTTGERRVGPRFAARPIGPVQIGQGIVVPPCGDTVDRFDLLLWDFWDWIHYGPFVKRGSRSFPGSQSTQTAHLWTVIEGTIPSDLRIGFTAYDDAGNPAPFWNFEPVPVAELLQNISSADRLDKLFRL